MFIITTQNETINQLVDMLKFHQSMKITNRKNKYNKIKEKYQEYNQVLDNPLYDDNSKQLFKEFIEKNEKIKSMCYKFYFKLKNKVSKIANTTDIYLTDNIEDMDPNNLITIYKKEFIWCFDMDQISQVIDKSLYYSYGLFPEPKLPKNPFTNIEFNLYELYKIHSMLKSNNKSSIYFDLFRLYKFNLFEFTENCYLILKHKSIENTIKDYQKDDIEILEDMEDIAYSIDPDKLCINSIKNALDTKPEYLCKIKRLLINYHIYLHNTKKFQCIKDHFVDLYHQYVEEHGDRKKPINNIDDIDIDTMTFEMGITSREVDRMR